MKKTKLIMLGFMILGWIVFMARDWYKINIGINQNTIFLNEVCTEHFSGSAQDDGNYYDYIELYNASDREVRLADYTLYAKTHPDKRYSFGAETIKAKSYLTLYLSDKQEEKSGYVDIRLSEEGDWLCLANSDGVEVDTVYVPTLQYDTSWSRKESGEWGVKTMTPGESNSRGTDLPRISLPAPTFSKQSGFYEDQVEVEINTYEIGENEEIHYTLDGSEPTMEDPVYREPLVFTDPSDSPNRYSNRTDISAGLLYTKDRFSVPSEPVDKAVILRAAAFSQDGKSKSRTATASYFIDFDREKYQGFPIVSLVMDPQDLFDYDTGIYVNGALFDTEGIKKILESMDREEGVSVPWRSASANYTARGKEWERRAHMDFFDADGEVLLGQDVGARIHGGYTRSYTQKSFNLYARGIYEEKKFKTPVLGQWGTGSVTLANGGNDSETQMKDILIHTLCADMDMETMEFMPCYVFLDGEFWGSYSLTEKYSGDYLYEHYGIDKGDIVSIKAMSLDEGEKEDIAYYEELTNYVETHSLAGKEEYQELCEKIDMQSYLDYYAVMLYLNRQLDWPNYNEAFWRTKTVSDEPYHDGKWRWMLFDLNSKCIDDPEDDSIAYVRERAALFDKLCENPIFRKALVQKMVELRDTRFSYDHVYYWISYYTSRLYPALMLNNKRYYDTYQTEETYWEEVQDFLDFFERRPQEITRILEENFPECKEMLN